MKTKYKIALGVLILFTIGGFFWVYYAPKNQQKSLGNALQIASVLTAGVAFIIALHGSNPKKK